MLMKRSLYESPQVDLVVAAVEQGFAASLDEWTVDNADVEWDNSGEN